MGIIVGIAGLIIGWFSAFYYYRLSSKDRRKSYMANFLMSLKRLS